MPVLETIDYIRVTTYRADPDAPYSACGDVVCCHCGKVVWS